jgi:lipid II:glycine glycyltransferase (peptidoglycan interpeptide bridge formation enzyme)
MTVDILTPEQYPEYEAFAEHSPYGQITQSTRWHGVKPGWRAGVVAARRGGEIIGGISVLARSLPVIGASLLYAPRGPVCDIHDEEVFSALMRGVARLAKKHRAYMFKIDPDIPESDAELLDQMRARGFSRFTGGDAFETIQARHNYRLYIGGRGCDELLASFTQKTRYNIRVALRRGVEVRVVGPERLDDFIRIMRTTGERDGFSTRPKSYFEGMLSALGPHCRLYMAFCDGAAVAGAVATSYAGRTCYVYGASDNVHRNDMPNYLVQWEMIKWAVENGSTVYDFQGVSGNITEESPLYGLYRFKKGFNGQLDTLCGEFDYIYRPMTAKLADIGIDAAEWLRRTKRRVHSA